MLAEINCSNRVSVFLFISSCRNAIVGRRKSLEYYYVVSVTWNADICRNSESQAITVMYFPYKITLFIIRIHLALFNS